MIRKTAWHQSCSYGCCRFYTGKSSAKQAEEALWCKDAEDELADDED